MAVAQVKEAPAKLTTAADSRRNYRDNCWFGRTVYLCGFLDQKNRTAPFVVAAIAARVL